MAFYGLATYLVIIISFNLPFLMEEYGCPVVGQAS